MTMKLLSRASKILADCRLHLEPQQKGREKCLALWHISIQSAAFLNIGFASYPDCAGESTAVDETVVKGQPEMLLRRRARKPRTDEDKGMANRSDVFTSLFVSHRWVAGHASFLLSRSAQGSRGREDVRHAVQDH